MSPRQKSKEFYEQKSRSFLGFGIYYFENGAKKSMNVDIISDNLAQTAYAVVKSFR
jgi:hypothetical protein